MHNPAGYSSLRRIGDFKHSARASDHDGWILCDGRTIKKTAYPRIFQALGIADASLTLPDAKDCLMLGAGGRLKVLERGGANTITLTVDNLPEHDHGYTDSTASATAGKASVLTSLLAVLSGLTTSDVAKRTGKAGKASPAPVKVEPLAIGANVFIYVGEPVA
ncbi:tail fiber protein [Antarcticirhabdus aurantiaca]|uniref:tail fiber protein n=1 Tax=Antarcticirhabdus aurantiaca TaxID=2606717 RepID=UPI00131A8E05|nr:tail fiber protein [Antarcticirhabdus aurantiaca]